MLYDALHHTEVKGDQLMVQLGLRKARQDGSDDAWEHCVSLIETYVIPIFGVILATLGIWYARASSLLTARQEAAERQRLNAEVFGQNAAASSTVPAGTVHTSPREESDHKGKTSSGVQEPSYKAGVAPRDAVYDQLLINDYALGLTQARAAFTVSMVFSILGGLVLVLGIALAIFRAETGGQVAGAAITSAAGVLTSGLSQLFRGQSTKALKHLESQAVELRKDVRAQTNAATAQRLLDEVADSELRSHLQAALILEFTGAKLPDLEKTSWSQAGYPNGSGRKPEAIGTASTDAPRPT